MSSPHDFDEDGGTDSGTARRSWEWVGVVWFTLLFVASIGVQNGDSNQNSYLLLGLRIADPGFLTGDWFTWETVHSHQVYGLFVALLARLGLLNVGLALGVTLQNALFALLVYAILRELYERPLIPWAASLVIFSAMDTMSLGAAPWLKSFLGVSTMSSVAMVLGLLLLTRRRFVAAGLALGLAGLLHAHFVVLSLPIMAAVSIERLSGSPSDRPWKVLALFWFAFLAVASPSLVQIARFMTAPGVHEIRWLTASLFPYHIAPWTWWRDPILVLVGAVLFGFGGVVLLPPRPRRAFAYAAGVIVLSVFVSLALAYRHTLDLASQTWLWRLSPLVLIGGIAAGMVAFTSPSRWTAARASVRWVGVGALLLGFVAILRFGRSPATHLLLLTAVIPVAMVVGHVLRRRWITSVWAGHLVATAVITAGFAPLVTNALEVSHLEFRPERPERSALYDWIRTSTSEEAIFAIPPSWEGFRINARRPIVADWKAVPRYAPDRIEWVERMRALTDIQRPGAERRELDDAFARMDCRRISLLRERYGVRFVVHERPKELDCGELVYEDDSFRVWDVRSRDVSVGPSGDPDGKR